MIMGVEKHTPAYPDTSTLADSHIHTHAHITFHLISYNL